MMLLKPNQHDPFFQFCKYQNKSYVVVDCKRLTSIDKLLTSPYSFFKTKNMFNLPHTDETVSYEIVQIHNNLPLPQI